MKFCILRWIDVVAALLTTGCVSVVLARSPCFGGTDHAPYVNWVNSEGSSFYDAFVCYNATSGADPTQGVALHWKVDDENLYLAVTARATGWVAFGLAEAGGMKGSDIVIFEVANPGILRDAHVLDVLLPIDDDCQDWVFKKSTIEDGFIIFEGYRKLDTLDSQDHFILEDSDSVIPAQRIIAAWGDDDTAKYHGLNRAQGSIRWYGGGDELELVHQKLIEQADGYFDLLVPNHTIIAKETDYVSFCFGWEPDVAPQGLSVNDSIEVIGVEAITCSESKPYVHHHTVTASTLPVNESRSCLSNDSYVYVIYAWAPGSLPLILPDNVGFLMGQGAESGVGDEVGGLQSFYLRVHYNNPKLVEGATDRGGIRVYYTHKKREFDVAIMGLGDSLTKLSGVSIPAGITQYEFGCPPGCSKLALDEPVTVIQEYIHMHNEGMSAVTYQLRNDEVIRESRIDYFDFAQSGTFPGSLFKK
jgi:DOMON domain/Copper type II ascorbate-dependent monooxygenase, N-terminal domain